MPVCIALDSNCLTYFINSMAPDYEPDKDNSGLVEEKVSLLRTFFYVDINYWVMPAVQAEYNKIKDINNKYLHDQTTGILLGEWQNENEIAIGKLKLIYLQFHKHDNDCRIAAEANMAKMDYLLTREDSFIKHLNTRTGKLTIIKPSDLWKELAISKGAKTKLAPHSTNPLYKKNWWKW